MWLTKKDLWYCATENCTVNQITYNVAVNQFRMTVTDVDPVLLSTPPLSKSRFFTFYYLHNYK